MAATRSADAVLSLCHKATVLGNKIAIHMLEYLGTVEKHSHQFDELAHEFMDTSRIMWSLEAGLAECTRQHQRLPAEMIAELDRKFRATTADFQVLDQILGRFLDYERKGTMGRLQKGWRSMFSSNDVEKMRENLEKTREALRMSSLVFQWSLGDDKIDESVGIGYTGLAAALERLSRTKTSSSAGAGAGAGAGIGGAGIPTSREKTGDVSQQVHEVHPGQDSGPPFLPPIPGLPNSRGSATERSSAHGRGGDDNNSSGGGHNSLRSHLQNQYQPPRGPAEREREPSLMNYTIKTSSSTRSASRGGGGGGSGDPSDRDRERAQRRMSIANDFDRIVLGHSGSNAGGGGGGGNDGGAGSVSSSGYHRRPSSNHHNNSYTHHTDSNTGADSLLADELDAFEPFKVVRFKADPASQPRWVPRNTNTSSSAGPGPGQGSNNGGDYESHALRESLVSAVESRNAKLAEQLLDRGVPPNLGPNAHVHLLNQAIARHDSEMVRVLLLFGADPNSPDAQGTTPLYTSVVESSLEAATMLLKYGADPNLPSGHDQETPLTAAVVEDKFNLARALLAYGGDATHVLVDGSTDSLLMAAIKRRRSRRVVDLLLGYGADANAKDGHGHTPLFEAIQSRRIEVVASLLDHRANPNLPGPKHMLWPAAGLPRILELLLARGADPRKAPGVMELATSENNLESVRVLLKAGVDANAKKDGIYTPLCSAIRDDRADIFDMLLAHGADPNLPSAEYPAFKCVTHYRTQYLQPLVTAGADLNTPKGILETAVQCHNLEALNWLLDSGKVSPNDKAPKTGATPLTTAIRENRPDLVELLLSRGADPNIRGENWPVCMAVKQPEILKRLLPALAEPRAFKGVMEMAVVANQIESIKLLLRAGVSVEDRNGGVFSPLTTAIRENRKDIVRFLLEEAGADVNAPGEHLPVVKALRRIHERPAEDDDSAVQLDTDILELLLRHGADPNQMYRGHNGFFQAVEDGNPDILRLLLSRCPGGAGVDLAARDDAGMTVLEVAASRGWLEGRAILLQGRGSPGADGNGQGAAVTAAKIAAANANANANGGAR